MITTRRDFLKTGSMVALGSSVPAFLSQTALATQQATGGNTPTGARDTILVVIQLTGGNDGLNTVVPFGDDDYARNRPTLRLRANQVLRLGRNADVGLHPSMTGLKDLFDDGKLAVVQGVGYPNPTQSHFRSMDIWQSAKTTGELNDGWVGRALNGVPGAVSFHLADQNEASPLALTGAPVRVPSITTLQDFQLKINGASQADTRRQRSLIEAAANVGNNNNQDDLLNFVRRTSTNTYQSSNRLREVGQNYSPSQGVTYPNTALANRLRLAAQLIDAGLGARLFYVSIGGFDTHARQENAHANLLTQVSGAMTAFYRDMAAKGHGDRILMMTFSEFGRRVRENGSQGTDHGTAAPMFLVGGKVRAGIVGDHPSLNNLVRGNLRHHTDFRQVYATVLDQWLGVRSRPILNGDYEAVNILRRS
ncbi:MAG: DUF1501 domain-containing protein [Gemmataceae bacterium]